MRNGMRLIGMAAVAAMALTALAVQDAVTLKRAPKVGETIKYHIKAEMEVPQVGTGEMNATVTDKVSKVSENGEYAIESTMTEGKFVYPGGEFDIPEQGASTTTYNPQGAILSLKEPSNDPSSRRLANMNAISFPSTPVKVGDTWKTVVKKDDQGSVDAEGSYKVEGSEKVGEYETLKITGTYKETSGEAPASASGTFWINVKDGTLVKMVGAIKNAPYPTVGPLDAKVWMTRDGVK